MVFLGWGPAVAHLWYLMAIIQSMIVIAIFSKLNITKYLGVFFLFFAFHFFLKDSLYNANFLFKGIPCISLGMFVSKYRERIISFRYYQYILIISLFLICFAKFEINLNLLRGTLLFISSFLIIFSSFVLCLQYSNFGKGSIIEKIGDKYSSNTYYLHNIFCLCFSRNYIASYQYNTWGLVYVTMATLILSIIVVKV